MVEQPHHAPRRARSRFAGVQPGEAFLLWFYSSRFCNRASRSKSG